MDLKEYIVNVLSEISEAITECNDIKNKKKFIVNPVQVAPRNAQMPIKYYKADDSGVKYTQPVNVDFDIALTVSNTDGGGVKVGANFLGLGVEGKTEHEEVNRVKFTLPVLLPTAIDVESDKSN